MPIWLLLVLVGQFLNAVVSMVDKFILTSKKIPKPIVYAFFVCLSSVFSLIVYLFYFLPHDFFQINMPSPYYIGGLSWQLALFSILVGVTFIFALYFIYSALTTADASDVIPVVGAINATLTFFLSFFILKTDFSPNFLYGFILLVAGTAIVSHFRFNYQNLLYAMLGGVFLSLHFFISKIIFLEWSFNTAFFWSRFGMGAVALCLFLFPFFRKVLGQAEMHKKHNRRKTYKNLLWVAGNAILGGTAGLLLLKAIDLGEVSIVQALGGLQFIFIAIIAFLVGRFTPFEFGEKHNKTEVIQKFISIVLISVGFLLLFI